MFDPACGSGNFLVIAYKEMREIEAEINKRRGEARASERNSAHQLPRHRAARLPAEIARLALIIAEFQCDVLYRGQKEALAEFLPLDAQNWITCGNALRLDWLSICPPTGTGREASGRRPVQHAAGSGGDRLSRTKAARPTSAGIRRIWEPQHGRRKNTKPTLKQSSRGGQRRPEVSGLRGGLVHEGG